MKTKDEQQIPVTVKEIKGETVVLDAIHPLAGQDLIFDVALVEMLESASDKSLPS